MKNLQVWECNIRPLFHKKLRKDYNEKKEEEIKNKKMDKNVKYYIEIDIQHIKYIIKDYFRIRLMKIEKYLFFSPQHAESLVVACGNLVP